MSPFVDDYFSDQNKLDDYDGFEFIIKFVYLKKFYNYIIIY